MSESQDQDRPVDDAGGVLSDPLGLIGKVVAKKYVIESYIGCGGFGEVYKGINVHLQKQRVVLKFFTNTRLSDKFEREARILSLLNHPSICGIHDYLPEQKAIVIPFIDGRDLGEILIETKQLPEEIFLRIAHAVTEALIAAHNEKIAHRDIKPSNIMIDKNNNVYLIDFGIAKEMTEPATWTKYNVLTPQFAAPERHGGGKEYNPFLSDIYELGVTLFYLATRMMPYRTPDNPQLDEWDDPHTRILAKPLKQILQKAAAPHPEDRYQTVHEMAADLRRIIHIYRRRRRLWIPATAASVIVLAGVAAYLWLAGRVPDAHNVDSRQESKRQTIDSVVTKAQVESVPSAPAKTLPAPLPDGGLKAGLPDRADPSAQRAKTPGSSSAASLQKSPPVKQETAGQPYSPPSPSPPPLPQLTVRADPIFNSLLYIDGREAEFDRGLALGQGEYEVKIVNPEFPVFVDRVQLNVNRTMSYSLANEFPSTHKMRLVIGGADLQGGKLQVVLNGKSRSYDAFPITDLNVIPGPWQIGFIIKNGTGGESRAVDSFVIFPFDPARRLFTEGSGGLVDFGSAKWQDLSKVDIVIYHSARPE